MIPVFVRSDSDTIAYDIQKILERQYTPGIDKIKSYGVVESGRIAGEFLAKGENFFYLIDPSDGSFTYRPGTASKQDSLSRFDAPRVKAGVKAAQNKAGKTLTCTPGKTYPCGKVCRAIGSPCKADPDAQSRALAEKAVAKIEAAQGGASRKTGQTAISKGQTSKKRQTPGKPKVAQENIPIDKIKGVPKNHIPHPDILESVKTQGTNLIPANLVKKDDGYEVITGQDFVSAAKQLGMESVSANIHNSRNGVAEDMGQLQAAALTKHLLENC